MIHLVEGPDRLLHGQQAYLGERHELMNNRNAEITGRTVPEASVPRTVTVSKSGYFCFFDPGCPLLVLLF